MQNLIITGIGSISLLGSEIDEIWGNYKESIHKFSPYYSNQKKYFAGKIKSKSEKKIKLLSKENNSYKKLDRSVLLAIIASRQAVKNSGWTSMKNVAINIGSSRGSTSLFEKYYDYFISSSNKRLSPLTSPTTTLGNIASWVAMDLGSNSATLSHSITCSTALHSVLNAAAWLNSGMSNKFLCGGSEAPLTDFTIAQMQALGIYSEGDNIWPSRPLEKNPKKNNMILSEAASIFSLEKNQGQNGIVKIIGLGFATEIIKHNASLSSDAKCIQKSMKMALKDANLISVDTIVMHAPGTIQGDISELKAIKKTFQNMPHLISTKHMSGHALGASGGLSLELGIMMLHKSENICFPYKNIATQNKKPPNTILINAVGFGGNAVSLVIQKA